MQKYFDIICLIFFRTMLHRFSCRMKIYLFIVLVSVVAADKDPLKCCILGSIRSPSSSATPLNPIFVPKNDATCSESNGIQDICQACATIYDSATKNYIQKCIKKENDELLKKFKSIEQLSGGLNKCHYFDKTKLITDSGAPELKGVVICTCDKKQRLPYCNGDLETPTKYVEHVKAPFKMVFGS